MNTFDPDVRITHKLSFISLTFVILTLCCVDMVLFFIPTCIPLLKVDHIFCVWIFFSCFHFLLGVSCAYTNTCIVHFKQCLFFFLSFLYFIFNPTIASSFCLFFAFNLLCAIFTVNSITSIHFASAFSFCERCRVFCCCRFSFEFQSVCSTVRTKRYQVVVPFYSIILLFSLTVPYFFFAFYFIIIFICYGTFNFNKWKLFSWIEQEKKINRKNGIKEEKESEK